MADRPAPPIDHARHDPLLIAALAAGDLADAERDRATRLVAGCPTCAALDTDLRAIARATTAEQLSVPSRPRSFTLRPADAARLRPTGVRGLIGRFGSPGWAITRPLAATLTTLGLAGLLVAYIPLGMGGSAASMAAPRPAGAPATDMTGDAEATLESRQLDASPAPRASAAAEEYVELSPSPGRLGAAADPNPSPAASPSRAPTPRDATASGGPSALLVASVLLLATGLGLFAITRLLGQSRRT